MNDHDDLLDVIRRARPDDLASARTPAAQALLEEILSMDATQTREATETRTAEVDVGDTPPVTPVSPGGRRRRQVLVGGIAAAVLAALAVAGGVVGGPGEPSRADAVEAALDRSVSMLAQSGRAEITWRTEWDGGSVESGTESWEFSGDDSSVTIDYRHDGVPFNCVNRPAPCEAEHPINRNVDGQSYIHVADEDGTYRWYRDTGNDWVAGLDYDPATLLDELDPAGGFDEVGRDQVDGVDTTRMRAADPAQTPVPGVVDFAGDTVTSLEVWVDDDGLVRRLDLETTDEDPRPGDSVVVSASLSVVFSDLGEPIAIEAPTDYQDIDPEA